jgi:hypothetical protein
MKMKRLISVLAALLLTAPLIAQQATLNSPIVTPDEHNYRVEELHVIRAGGNPRWEMELSVRDSAGTADIRRIKFSGPDTAHPTATVLALATAFDTVVPGEPTNDAAALNYRALDYLIDFGYLTNVTLAP